jgi:hypothetical protein
MTKLSPPSRTSPAGARADACRGRHSSKVFVMVDSAAWTHAAVVPGWRSTSHSEHILTLDGNLRYQGAATGRAASTAR